MKKVKYTINEVDVVKSVRGEKRSVASLMRKEGETAGANGAIAERRSVASLMTKENSERGRIAAESEVPSSYSKESLGEKVKHKIRREGHKLWEGTQNTMNAASNRIGQFTDEMMDAGIKGLVGDSGVGDQPQSNSNGAQTAQDRQSEKASNDHEYSSHQKVRHRDAAPVSIQEVRNDHPHHEEKHIPNGHQETRIHGSEGHFASRERVRNGHEVSPDRVSQEKESLGTKMKHKIRREVHKLGKETNNALNTVSNRIEKFTDKMMENVIKGFFGADASGGEDQSQPGSDGIALSDAVHEVGDAVKGAAHAVHRAVDTIASVRSGGHGGRSDALSSAHSEKALNGHHVVEKTSKSHEESKVKQSGEPPAYSEKVPEGHSVVVETAPKAHEKSKVQQGEEKYKIEEELYDKKTGTKKVEYEMNEKEHVIKNDLKEEEKEGSALKNVAKIENPEAEYKESFDDMDELINIKLKSEFENFFANEEITESDHQRERVARKISEEIYGDAEAGNEDMGEINKVIRENYGIFKKHLNDRITYELERENIRKEPEQSYESLEQSVAVGA